jgi:acetyl-CoA carboxylase carboxyl transferase subunit alpha
MTTSGGKSQYAGRAVLEFEKPLAEIEQQIQNLEAQNTRDCSAEARNLRATLVKLMKKTYSNLSPAEKVQLARHQNRPQVDDYIDMIVRDFCELHGDRNFRDDRAIVTGFGRIGGQKCLVVGHRKGKDIKEKVECYFGCAHPEGYRKALQKMKLAEKFRLPIVCLIDTPGAYPGIGAEERGIAYAIANNLFELSRLRTPIVCIVIAEGGSGGALGIGIGDRVAVMEHAYYSVISPEGCAGILWRTAEKSPEAANALKLTPQELKRLDLIDDIVKEPLGGAHRDPMAAAASLEHYVAETLTALKRQPIPKLMDQRYTRLRNLGSFFTDSSASKKKVPARRSDLAVPGKVADMKATASAKA